MFSDFDTEIQSDEIIPEEYEDWLAMIERANEEAQTDPEMQDRWYHETFGKEIWSDFLEQMTYAND